MAPGSVALNGEGVLNAFVRYDFDFPAIGAVERVLEGEICSVSGSLLTSASRPVPAPHSSGLTSRKLRRGSCPQEPSRTGTLTWEGGPDEGRSLRGRPPINCITLSFSAHFPRLCFLSHPPAFPHAPARGNRMLVSGTLRPHTGLGASQRPSPAPVRLATSKRASHVRTSGIAELRIAALSGTGALSPTSPITAAHTDACVSRGASAICSCTHPGVTRRKMFLGCVSPPAATLHSQSSTISRYHVMTPPAGARVCSAYLVADLEHSARFSRLQYEHSDLCPPQAPPHRNRPLGLQEGALRGPGAGRRGGRERHGPRGAREDAQVAPPRPPLPQGRPPRQRAPLCYPAEQDPPW